ncbi:hypothetical protein [Amycolatopsis arida]|uniref:hypothetical protein n=1 Tax=Amycolatopsis arida TaxID=587909 RepID=UPI000B88D4D1|nr:hypothetical protein [Amycolatopsis arida]
MAVGFAGLASVLAIVIHFVQMSIPATTYCSADFGPYGPHPAVTTVVQPAILFGAFFALLWGFEWSSRLRWPIRMLVWVLLLLAGLGVVKLPLSEVATQCLLF